MKQIIIATAILAFFSGCLKSNDAKENCNYDECAVKAPVAEIESVRAYLGQKGIAATEHCSGVFYAIDSAGTGDAPAYCSYIGFRYKGMLTNGNGFDSSATTTPYYRLKNLVPGWINVLPKIKKGGGMRIYIPPTLGYGTREIKDNSGRVLIPANSILVFEVKLDAVSK